ncbi:unnamed protein product, partial [Mesorhabditis spiculigera]
MLSALLPSFIVNKLRTNRNQNTVAPAPPPRIPETPEERAARLERERIWIQEMTERSKVLIERVMKDAPFISRHHSRIEYINEIVRLMQRYDAEDARLPRPEWKA